jgi:hypothetical protein
LKRIKKIIGKIAKECLISTGTNKMIKYNKTRHLKVVRHFLNCKKEGKALYRENREESMEFLDSKCVTILSFGRIESHLLDGWIISSMIGFIGRNSKELFHDSGMIPLMQRWHSKSM